MGIGGNRDHVFFLLDLTRQTLMPPSDRVGRALSGTLTLFSASLSWCSGLRSSVIVLSSLLQFNRYGFFSGDSCSRQRHVSLITTPEVCSVAFRDD